MTGGRSTTGALARAPRPDLGIAVEVFAFRSRAGSQRYSMTATDALGAPLEATPAARRELAAHLRALATLIDHEEIVEDDGGPR